MSEKVRVTVEIKGGVLQAVYAGEFVEVMLVDYDNINEGDGQPEPYPVIPENNFVRKMWDKHMPKD